MKRLVPLSLLSMLSLMAACQPDGRASHSACAHDASSCGDGHARVAQASQATAQSQAASAFQPPAERDIPDGPYGDTVRRGLAIFLDTPAQAPAYVGNGLTCANCHLDAGRRPDSAPLWAAFGRYPAYRKKTRRVDTYADRLQGCFVYSMDGKAPPAGSPELVALEAYSAWMAQGAPVGVALRGAGYPKDERPARAPDYARGARVYRERCALCHGDDGQGQRVAGRYVFPPLWGPDSFNWGAGMHQLDNAAAFIRANMPLGLGGTLDVQQAWDVAMFMDAHERPQDPRYTGDLAEARARFHDSPDSLYGLVVEGHRLGSAPAKRE